VTRACVKKLWRLYPVGWPIGIRGGVNTKESSRPVLEEHPMEGGGLGRGQAGGARKHRSLGRGAVRLGAQKRYGR